MYAYNIGYSSWEGGATICLTHVNKYSKADLNKIIARIALDLMNEIKADDEKHNIESSYNTFESTLFSHCYCADDECKNGYSYLEEKLVTEYGFQQMQFAEHWNCEGWAIMNDPKSWAHCRTPENNYVTKYLNDNGFPPPKKENKNERNRKK